MMKANRRSEQSRKTRSQIRMHITRHVHVLVTLFFSHCELPHTEKRDGFSLRPTLPSYSIRAVKLVALSTSACNVLYRGSEFQEHKMRTSQRGPLKIGGRRQPKLSTSGIPKNTGPVTEALSTIVDVQTFFRTLRSCTPIIRVS